MHKLKYVHDTFKVLQLSFHPNHCIFATFLTTNLTFKILHSYHNAPVKQWTDSQPQHLQNKKKAFQNHAQAALDISAIDKSADLYLVSP